PPPRVGLIVRKNDAGQWMDDNNGNWTNLVSGPSAALSGRVPGWNLPDHDVAVINANTLDVSYVDRLMNLCMAINVDPASGRLFVVGTDAINEVRFEPVVGGIFVRVLLATVDPLAAGGTKIFDLNPHLDYATHTVPQDQRNRSIGDPRAVVWNAANSRAYVAGMGSNNVIVIGQDGSRAGLSQTIEVGEGPTGLALNAAAHRLFVLNKFNASISTIDTVSETEIDRAPFFDPTPVAIKTGRKHLYDTHRTSGLGQLACASCHIDARMDRLAWDLGDPSGDMKNFDQSCNLGVGLLGTCDDWHPMKGPMTSQTLQDIIGNEPHHWRGDRNGLEEFNPAFVGLLGDDSLLTPSEMQEFEDFLATLTFPPNPFRNIDNSLPTNLPLPGHFSTGRFAAAGTPLPNGNAVNGLNLYTTAQLDMVAGLNIINCVTCHTLPTGMGSNRRLVGGQAQPFPVGPNGEQHLTVVSVDGSTNGSIKVPHLRNLYEKVGFEMTQGSNRAGFGFLHDGSVDSIARFVSEPVFSLDNTQQLADMVAFMLSFSGSDLPVGTTNNVFNLRGPDGQDTHAAVGFQLTVDANNHELPGVVNALNFMIELADSDRVGLVAKGVVDGHPRGYMHAFNGLFQSDRAAGLISDDDLRLAAGDAQPITFTVVPFGTQTRMGIDRDTDGFFDGDELENCSNSADATSNPGNVVITGDRDGSGAVDLVDYAVFDGCVTDGLLAASGPHGVTAAGSPPTLECRCAFDFDRDGLIDLRDFASFQRAVGS
ncbi:MAG: hypothetical protein HOP29_12190, partial [Phycisphaerales bacterium]|nr:hypothetical protein [Phycisphaerales bacterium]